MGLFTKKYRYVSVFFQNGRKPYAYRTEDKTIKINDVVMVPVAGGEIRPAIVAKVQTCAKKDAPYPPNKTKMIIGRADRETSKAFADIDMRVPMDISIKSVGTANSVVLVVTDQEERDHMKAQFGNQDNIKLIETQPVSKANRVISREELKNP